MTDPQQPSIYTTGFDLLVIVAIGAVLMLPSLRDGPPVGHDYPFHRAYMDAVAAQMAAGEPFPRWLTALWDGAGGPDLFFYPPLTYWLGGVVRVTFCPGCTADDLLLVTGVFWQALYGAGLRSLGLRWFGRWPALAGAVLGMALPYHLGTDWVDRFAFAEFAIAALIPWHLAAALDSLAGRAAGLRLAVLTGLILLGHIVTAVMLAAVYPFLVVALGRGADWRTLSRLAVSAGVGAVLAAVYWYGAATLRDSVNVGFMSQGVLDPTAWLFWPEKLMLRDPMVIGLWPSFFAMCAATLTLLALSRAATPEARRLIATLVVVTIVMQTPLAWPLFEYTPLRNIQFPWRYLVISGIGFALTGGLAVKALWDIRQAPLRLLLYGVCLAVFVLAAVKEHPGLRGSRNVHQIGVPRLLEMNVGFLSWFPIEAEEAVRLDLQSAGVPAVRTIVATPPVQVIPDTPGTQVTLVSGAPRRLEYEITLPAPARVVFRRTYWRYSELRLEPDGTKFPLRPTPGFPLTAADLPAGAGRYVLELPTLPQERTGLAISLAGLLAAAGWLLSGLRRKGPVRAPERAP